MQVYLCVCIFSDQLDVFPVLSNLTTVRRFTTMVMFLSSKDKQGCILDCSYAAFCRFKCFFLQTVLKLQFMSTERTDPYFSLLVIFKNIL